MTTRTSAFLVFGALVATAACGCEGEAECTNTCEYAFDGECDDGGSGSDYDLCALGTDCSDCGSRASDAGPGDSASCTNTCRFAHDGECDDGGQGSDYAVCDYGTDCADCGVRGSGDDGHEDGGASGGGSWGGGYEECDLGDPLAICLCLNPDNYHACWDI